MQTQPLTSEFYSLFEELMCLKNEERREVIIENALS